MLTLRELHLDDEKAFLKGLSFWGPADWSWFSFVYKEGMSHKTHLDILSKNKNIETVVPGKVPDTMLYAFVGEEIVGRVSIRHALNDFLRERGGHIGYAVNFPYRKKGYGSLILDGALKYCKNNLGLVRVLITCSDKNMASIKMIQNIGGIMENQIHDESNNEIVNRYWVELE